MKATDAQLRAIKKYDAKMSRQYRLKLNLKTDADIIAALDAKPNMQGYIKALIRADIDAHKQ